MFIIRYRKILTISSALFALLCFCTIFVYGLPLGIDFTGGSIVEVSYRGERPSNEAIEEKLNVLSLGTYQLQPTGENRFIISTKTLSEAEHLSVLDAFSLSKTTEAVEERFNTVGPLIGDELRRKALFAIFAVLLGIVSFVAFAFRKVSRPVASWKYGLATLLSLAHDVLIPTGVFVVLGHMGITKIDILFVTGILAVLAYSVHDTIVVFDRVRENLRVNEEHRKKESFDITVGRSLMQTFGRSINTSLTIFIVLVALFFFGSESTKFFNLLLLVGVVAGTYSSIFLAAPFLVLIHDRQEKKT